MTPAGGTYRVIDSEMTHRLEWPIQHLFSIKRFLRGCYGLQEATLQGNPVNRSSLEALRPEGFSSILILADDTEQWAALAEHGCADNLADADSRCLASLLLLRDIQSSRMHYSNTRQSSEKSSS